METSKPNESSFQEVCRRVDFPLRILIVFVGMAGFAYWIFYVLPLFVVFFFNDWSAEGVRQWAIGGIVMSLVSVWLIALAMVNRRRWRLRLGITMLLLLLFYPFLRLNDGGAYVRCRPYIHAGYVTLLMLYGLISYGSERPEQ